MLSSVNAQSPEVTMTNSGIPAANLWIWMMYSTFGSSQSETQAQPLMRSLSQGMSSERMA